MKKLTENLITYQRLLQTNIYSQLESQDAIKKLERDIKNYKKAMNGKLLSQKNFYITPDRLNSWRNQKLRIVYYQEIPSVSFIYQTGEDWATINYHQADRIIFENNMQKWHQKNQQRIKDSLLITLGESIEATLLQKLITKILNPQNNFAPEHIDYFLPIKLHS